MLENHKLLKRVFIILVIISFIVTAMVGIFLTTNYQNIGKMLEVAAVIKTQYLGDISVKQMMAGAVRGMVESLDDPYSAYMDKEEYQEFRQHIEGSIGGIGIYVSVKDEKFIVFSVIEGTPASKAGVQKGDVIYKVNYKLASEMDVDEAVAKMRGEPGTEVKISVLRAGSIKDFTIVRDVIDIPTVESEVLPEKIGYLRLNLFASNSDEALVEHLDKLKRKKIEGLVLDLRDNPGGDLEAAVNIARYFVPKGPVVYIVDKKGRTKSMDNNQPVKLGVPLVVLINGGSASASEVLAGAIKDTNSGILIGEKSFGKALVQVLIEMKGQDALKLTTAKYLTPNKHDIQAKGIEPNLEVILKNEDQEDTQLKKALEILQKQLER
ncbi:MAG: S41 family peptidase [Clostridia bacterium]|nr:S41 family peptidase [Clostridia bacterium]MDD4146050.1 S41 family peptidase [Clostridia bacterium]MDD4666315.1 S41 family peptidase [Clostridia bacterium]